MYKVDFNDLKDNWIVVDDNGNTVGSEYEYKEDAQELTYLLNTAYGKGLEEGRQ